MNNLPLLIEPEDLEQSASYDNVVIVDLSKPATYLKLHVPGAVHLDYAPIVAANKPVMGLVPDDATLTSVFSGIGIDDDTHVIAYDDEGGGKAARLLWTLAVAGHDQASLLNGGLHAWANEGHKYDAEPVTSTPRHFTVRRTDTVTADSHYINSHLDDKAYALLDVRSPAEYSGAKKFAERAGHIPGAVNSEWTLAMDQSRNLRLKPDDELLGMYDALGITPAKEVITYCQTHHRSAHTWLVLKHLGFDKVKGYPGSWSDWGNNPELPVE